MSVLRGGGREVGPPERTQGGWVCVPDAFAGIFHFCPSDSAVFAWGTGPRASPLEFYPPFGQQPKCRGLDPPPRRILNNFSPLRALYFLCAAPIQSPVLSLQ